MKRPNSLKQLRCLRSSPSPSRWIISPWKFSRKRTPSRQAMSKIFVEGQHMSEADFKACWPVVDPQEAPKQAVHPFIQVAAEHQLLPLETSLKLIVERSRLCFLPVERYEVDMELARGFP